MDGKLKITNGQILTPFRIIRNGTIVVTDSKITDVREGGLDLPDAIEIDAKGQYISPGFIDIHVHGGGGYDFMDATVKAFLNIAEIHAKHGTTSMLPTTLTAEKEDLFLTLDTYKQAKKENRNGSEFLGMHLEGPYFNVNQRGAQDPRYIRNPDPAEYKDIMRYGSDIKRWSAAPELPGSIEFARYLRSNGVLVALGHTDATYDEALIGYENGFTLATHFYSCMTGVTRKQAMRYAGTIEAGYLLEGMDVEVIGDGIHCPPPLLKLIYKTKGTDRIALITDAMRAAGMPEGESILGSLRDGLKVIVEDGVAKLPDRSSFAGSVATADRLVRTMVKMADIPLLDAVKMATMTPASILNVFDRKGSLIPGKDADIVIFNDDIQIQMTMVNGRIIYKREG
ncbi:MAG: N-acetylglucosamine-6-phosphate deacetylase [Chitinophagaceae bacterium]|nr:N-acetylglucosamine-6-phosphate deacetylase [Chitinophagaceae bacterium]